MEQVINPAKRFNKKPDSGTEVMDAFDKTNWRPITFGEVCRNINITDKDPLSNGIQRYVGLEHIEPNSLHIKSWGNVSDGTTFTKRFHARHVLFGKRRAYLRKAAIADFDGVCSGDILVFEANEDIMLLDLFPFLVQSTRFFDFAVQTSAGSLSPRTKFHDLAKFEFLLPPKEQQAKLAELLWAADDVTKSYCSQSLLFDNIISLMSEKLLWDSNYELELIREIVIDEIGEFVDGDWIESKDQSDKGIRLIQLADIGIREFIDKSKRFISDDTFKKLKCFEILAGDILIARMPEPLGRACIFPDIRQRAITAVDVCIVRVDSAKHNPKYWQYLFNSNSWFRLVSTFGSGTTRTRISRKNIESINAPMPSKSEQNEIVAKLDKVNEAKLRVTQNIDNSKRVLHTIINQVFR